MKIEWRIVYILLIITFFLEHIFGVLLLPAAVLVSGIRLSSSRVWFLVGILGILNDILGSNTLGRWGVSFIIPISIALALLRSSRLRPHPGLIAVFSFVVTVAGSLISGWLSHRLLTVPSRSMLLVTISWSIFFVLVFEFFRRRVFRDDLMVRYEA